MAHFAKLDGNNVVEQVIVVSNDVLNNEPFPQSEQMGIDFCKSLYGSDTNWAQTSYNGNFRYNYAGAGYSFDVSATPDGAFVPPQPYPSWTLDTSNYQWQSPVPYPNDGKMYYWDEATQSWVAVPTMGE